MPRKKKSVEEEKKQEEVNKKGEDDSSKQKKKRKSSSSKEKYIDPSKLLDEYLDEVVNGLGLAYLELSREEYKELLEETFAGAVGEVKTKPKVSTILNRLNANRDNIMEFLAMKLYRLKELDKMNDSQFEFVVYNTKRALIDLAPKLYEEAKRRNRQDLIDYLRGSWNTYGLRSPLVCPKCGFYSIMPDFVCRICGYEVSMREVKSQIKVTDLLIQLSKLSPEDFKEILSAGYFYYGWEGIIPPSKYKPSQYSGEPQMYFEIVLSRDEKEKLKSLSIVNKV
ncbi:MAG: hypothetical protein OWQ54_03745 [Sulfolobaceae archaeon]|nr:hypothetical protein [Sulfolobaceae archaeon]